MKIDQENYFLIDVQVRGYYPKYSLNKMERDHILPNTRNKDKVLLKKHKSISYHFLITIVDV